MAACRDRPVVAFPFQSLQAITAWNWLTWLHQTDAPNNQEQTDPTQGLFVMMFLTTCRRRNHWYASSSSGWIVNRWRTVPVDHPLTNLGEISATNNPLILFPMRACGPEKQFVSSAIVTFAHIAQILLFVLFFSTIIFTHLLDLAPLSFSGCQLPVSPGDDAMSVLNDRMFPSFIHRCQMKFSGLRLPSIPDYW